MKRRFTMWLRQGPHPCRACGGPTMSACESFPGLPEDWRICIPCDEFTDPAEDE